MKDEEKRNSGAKAGSDGSLDEETVQGHNTKIMSL